MKQKSVAAAGDNAATASTSVTVSTDRGPTASVQTFYTGMQQNYTENDVGHFTASASMLCFEKENSSIPAKRLI